ncbi:nicotinamide riboside transporter PnuC [Kamptonema cortianum]|nr:nicotinamide riboside transporter PnuC [Geitlerinema splendidum]MDK3156212.1 nicotinamide riboside transporter PnuC [Kamptonema cortianum]
MDRRTAVWCLVLALASYVVCVLAQSFPLWSAGQSFAWFPQTLDTQIELVAFVAGVVAVYLVTRESLWNWPIGIVNVSLYAWFFFAVAQHYANAALQIVWLIYLIDGWYRWLRGGEKKTELKVSHLTARQGLIVGATVVVFTVALVPILQMAGGKVVIVDALTTAMSLAAQYLLNRKVIQSWLAWIVVDLIYVPLYIYREYYATAVLYAIFLGLAVVGWFQWKKSILAQDQEVAKVNNT